MKLTKILGLTCSTLIMSFSYADPHHPLPKTAPEFESLKKLAGTWEGTTTMNGKTQMIQVNYKLSSGGSAVVETLFPGTEQEMTTIYHSTPKKVTVTHYCMLGNQPQLKLVKHDANMMKFAMDGTKGLTSKNEDHMSGVTLSWKDNALRHEWVGVEKGKTKEPSVFEFTKKL